MDTIDSMMMSEMGLTGLSGLANMFVSAQERSIQKIMDNYNNTMAALSAAQSKNALTRNEVAIGQQVKLAEAADQAALIQDKEAARVAAATAGVSGNSVDSTLHSFVRTKAQREMARTMEERAQYGAINDQRRQVELNLAYGKSISVIPNTIPSDLLGLTGNLLNVYKSYQPETYQNGG